MASPRVSTLSKDDITAAARNFHWTKQMPKWSVIVEGRELPARPLILDAAGVPPNDPTNSHQAVKILQQQGFEVRYQGQIVTPSEKTTATNEMEELITRLRGSCKGGLDLLELWEREHRQDEY